MWIWDTPHESIAFLLCDGPFRPQSRGPGPFPDHGPPRDPARHEGIRAARSSWAERSRSFNFEVLGVQRGTAPGRSMILVRASGGPPGGNRDHAGHERLSLLYRRQAHRRPVFGLAVPEGAHRRRHAHRGDARSAQGPSGDPGHPNPPDSAQAGAPQGSEVRPPGRDDPSLPAHGSRGGADASGPERLQPGSRGQGPLGGHLRSVRRSEQRSRARPW